MRHTPNAHSMIGVARNRNAILRFDVSSQIGFGHFKRALTLSAHLDRYMFAVPVDTIPLLRQEGIPKENILSLDAAPPSWTSKDEEFGHVIFDICYAGNRSRAEQEISRACSGTSFIAVVDSMPPDHFSPKNLPGERLPDLVVTPYLDAYKLRNPPPAVSWAAGPQFAILDRSYALTEGQSHHFPQDPGILVTCGGSDPTELSLLCLKALHQFTGKVHLVVGPLFSNGLIRKIQDAASRVQNVQLHFYPRTLARLLTTTNLVVGRPGLIRYEAAALGRNSIFLSETESYKEYYKNFQQAGLAEMYFSWEPGGLEGFVRRLATLQPRDPVFGPNLHARTVVRCDGARRFLDLVFRSNHGEASS